MVENIMCAKLKRRRLSSLIPLTALSFAGVAGALPGSYKKKKRTKEWMENSLTGNSKIPLNTVFHPFCVRATLTQVSTTGGWEVDPMICKISISQLQARAHTHARTHAEFAGGENRTPAILSVWPGWRPIR